MTEDFCGVEPITHPPIELETRKPPIIDEDKLRKAYNQVDSAILGCKYPFIKYFFLSNYSYSIYEKSFVYISLQFRFLLQQF